MDTQDRALIFAALKNNRKLERLYSEHEEIEEILARYNRRSFLTVSEEQEVKELKRKKLAGVDKMMLMATKTGKTGAGKTGAGLL